jgi:hypothetical protein
MPIAGEQDHEQYKQHQEWLHKVAVLIWPLRVSYFPTRDGAWQTHRLTDSVNPAYCQRGSRLRREMAPDTFFFKQTAGVGRLGGSGHRRRGLQQRGAGGGAWTPCFLCRHTASG